MRDPHGAERHCVKRSPVGSIRAGIGIAWLVAAPLVLLAGVMLVPQGIIEIIDCIDWASSHGIDVGRLIVAAFFVAACWGAARWFRTWTRS